MNDASARQQSLRNPVRCVIETVCSVTTPAYAAEPHNHFFKTAYASSLLLGIAPLLSLCVMQHSCCCGSEQHAMKDEVRSHVMRHLIIIIITVCHLTPMLSSSCNSRTRAASGVSPASTWDVAGVAPRGLGSGSSYS